MKSNTELLAIAKAQIGKNGAEYREYVGVGGPWCDIFVFWLFDANECGELIAWKGQHRYYCPASIKWCEKNLAEIPPYLAMACDIVYYDWDGNGNPNHIGIVEKHRDTKSIYSIEGNTSGGIVDNKIRKGYMQAIFRPHFKGEFKLQRLAVDGDCGYNTIASFQVLLKKKGYYNGAIDGILGILTVKALQKFVGTAQDGAWGPKTSKAFQGVLAKEGYYKGKIDSEFGEQSVSAMQKYINAKCYATEIKPTPKPAETKVVTKATLKSHRIEVDLTNQICTVYGVYSDGTTKPIMSEFVSTARKGKSTPVGNWKIQGASGGRKAKYRTAKLSGGKSYAEYLVRFKGAKCMHTVPYSKRQTTGHVNKNEFNKLGTPRSAGCVRMPNKMAKYIYNNCPLGTPVKVFKGTSGKYPMGKPTKYTATSNIDPTYR